MELRRPVSLLPSAIALVLANLVPLYGVLAWGWSALSLFSIYCAEMAVVAAFSLLRIVFAHPLNWGAWVLKVVALPFLPFLLLPMAFAVLFVTGLAVALLGSDTLQHATVSILFAPSKDPTLMPLDQALQALGFELGPQTLVVIAALAASHLVSFIWNYLIRGECNRAGLGGLVVVPLVRVWLITTVVTFAAVFADRLQAPAALLVALVAAKTTLDLLAHLKEHQPVRPA